MRRSAVLSFPLELVFPDRSDEQGGQGVQLSAGFPFFRASQAFPASLIISPASQQIVERTRAGKSFSFEGFMKHFWGTIKVWIQS